MRVSVLACLLALGVSYVTYGQNPSTTKLAVSPALALPPSTATAEKALRVAIADGEMALFVSGSGAPTVILGAGMGGDHRTWAAVQPALSTLTRTVSYDRLGSSNRSKRLRSASNYVEELREGLRKAGIAPPYVLVGHSLGGALVRVFAGRYPDQVAGIVLVDPAMERFYRRAAVEAPQAYLDQMEEDWGSVDASGNERSKRELLAFEASMQQLRLTPPPLGQKVVILSAARIKIRDPLPAIWLDEHARWAKEVGATHTYVQSGHSIHREQPAAVIEAVRQVLEKSAR